MSDETHRERLVEINRIGSLWPNGWTRAMAAEYELALRATPPREIAYGVTRATKTRTTRPAPSQILDLIEEGRAETEAARRRERSATVGEGQGCPHCRHAGTRAEWVNGSDTLAYCPTHNTAWRGQVPEPRDTLGSQPLPDDIWLSKALNGDFGPLVQGVARRRQETSRKKPDAPQDAALTDVMKELAHG